MPPLLVALFTIGAAFECSQINSTLRPSDERYVPVALINLAVYPLLAERFGADNGHIARIILLSTDGKKFHVNVAIAAKPAGLACQSIDKLHWTEAV